MSRRVVERHIDADVQKGVKEGVKPERAAMFRRRAPVEDGAQRRGGKRENEQCDGGKAGALLKVLDGVDGQAAAEDGDQHPREGQDADNVNGNLDGGEF